MSGTTTNIVDTFIKDFEATYATDKAMILSITLDTILKIF